MLIEGSSGVAIAAAIKAGAGALSGTSIVVSCGANISRSTLQSVL
jgi:hypothetical protein